MGGLLLICMVTCVLGLVLRSVGLRIERRAHLRLMEMEHAARWHESP
jgi:hypothetical protein